MTIKHIKKLGFGLVAILVFAAMPMLMSACGSSTATSSSTDSSTTTHTITLKGATS